MGQLTINPLVADETVRDFDFPQREAAFFYGLFLRGHSADNLRRDISVPPEVLAKWHREAEREPQLRSVLYRWSSTGDTSSQFLSPSSAAAPNLSGSSSAAA